MVEPMPDGSIRVNARLAVDELNELLRAHLPEGDWDSVGGLVFHLLGRVAGEGAVVEVDGFTLRVDRVTGRRISRVVVTRVAPDPSASDDRDDERPRSRRGDDDRDGGRVDRARRSEVEAP